MVFCLGKLNVRSVEFETFATFTLKGYRNIISPLNEFPNRNKIHYIFRQCIKQNANISIYNKYCLSLIFSIFYLLI